MSRSAIQAMNIVATGVLIVLGAWSSVSLAGADDVTPESLIRDMSKALTTLNYEGSFVHLQNGNIEAMSIVHSNDHGGEKEYMLSLNGEAREVYRDRALVMCIWPGSKSVVVSDAKSRKILPQVDSSLTNKEFYQLTLGESDRVAGKATHVVNVQPKDQYRYGYRFWVDKETNMLLRSMLVDDKDNPIEQVMFTSIDYPESIEQERFETPDEQIVSFKRHVAKASNFLDDKNRVNFLDLPKGYMEISESYEPRPLSDGAMSHIMLSDGMASVSVYVEYIQTG